MNINNYECWIRKNLQRIGNGLRESIISDFSLKAEEPHSTHKYSKTLFSVSSTATKPQAGRAGFNSRQKQWWDLFVTVSKPALGPNQSPIQSVSEALIPG